MTCGVCILFQTMAQNAHEKEKVQNGQLEIKFIVIQKNIC